MRKLNGVMRIHDSMINGLKDLIEYIPYDNISVVEIGVFLGESTEIFAKSNKVSSIIAVDPHEFKYDTIKWCLPEVLEDVHDDFVNNVVNVYPKVKYLRMYSEDAVKTIEDKSIDLVYIDADHREEFVTKDIQMWLSKLKSGGYMSGHDYADGVDQGGVIKAVLKTIGEPDKVFQDYSFIKRV